MAKIWLKIWLKVKENGTKKIKLAKMVAKEKEILVRTLLTLNKGFKNMFELLQSFAQPSIYSHSYNSNMIFYPIQLM